MANRPDNLCCNYGVCKTQRIGLFDVIEVCAPSGTVAKRLLYFIFCVTDNDSDVSDAGSNDRFDTEIENRFVSYRYKLLGACVGDRPEPRSFSSGENQSFKRFAHGFLLISFALLGRYPGIGHDAFCNDRISKLLRSLFGGE